MKISTYYIRKQYKQKSGNAGNRTRAFKPVGRCYTDRAIPTMYPHITSLLSANFTSMTSTGVSIYILPSAKETDILHSRNSCRCFSIIGFHDVL
jgi:hypothetical protein